MSVNITLEKLSMGADSMYKSNGINYHHCHFNGAIVTPLGLTQTNRNPPSRNFKNQLSGIVQSLHKADRQLGVVFLFSYTSDLMTYNTTTRMLIYGELLEKIRLAHPGISLTLSATFIIKNGNPSKKILEIPFKQKLLHSSETEYYKPEDLTGLQMCTGTNCYITEGTPANFYKLGIFQAGQRITLADFTLTLKISGEEEYAELINANPMMNPTYYKSILSKGRHTDLVIVARDGTEFNCHKCFITAQSDVFEAMLASGDLQEGKSSRIEITDTSKEGILALLGFIYAFDIEPARENAEIAVELLQAGHKYNIRELVDSMMRLILTWPEKILEVESKIEVVIGLFAFARNVDGLKNIKKRAFEVLHLRREEFISCELYKELFKKDVSAAMELCALALRR